MTNLIQIDTLGTELMMEMIQVNTSGVESITELRFGLVGISLDGEWDKYKNSEQKGQRLWSPLNNIVYL